MEEIAKQVTLFVSHVVEIISATVIGLAVIKVMIQYFFSRESFTDPLLWKGQERPEAIRIRFGSSVAVALELLLGADVLATAVAPTWEAIGKLAAIAVLRTALNYFLERELHQMHVAGSEKNQNKLKMMHNEAIV
ncbi:hypothetical protein BH10BAC3_BH10BAC3_05390 [soil metagenome]